jgi:Family of unknown function (DUF6247)
MTAQPIHDSDPDDPVQILRVLPEAFHRQFLAEYRAAVEAARDVAAYRQLHDLLRMWRLRAVAYADPGYDARLQAARDGRPVDFVPAEQVIPGWPPA